MSRRKRSPWEQAFSCLNVGLSQWMPVLTRAQRRRVVMAVLTVAMVATLGLLVWLFLLLFLWSELAHRLVEIFAKLDPQYQLVMFITLTLIYVGYRHLSHRR